jgi:pSer/pThr/pTyr-binding forkhead associated (FHA) protein
MSSSPSAPLHEVAVQLLDSATGRVLKSWRFRGKGQISIGRLPECDVEINDPYVSRLHAELQFRDEQWNIVSRGRHGVLVRNEPVMDLPLKTETTFQLGSAGPMFRFGVASQEQDCRRTLVFDDEPLPALSLDGSKLNQEVEQIASGSYFQTLQAQARSLRAKRQASLDGLA